MNCWCHIRAVFYLIFMLTPGYAYANTLTMAIIDLPPYGCISSADESPCVHNFIAEELSVHPKFTIVPVVVPYPRAIRMLESGAADTLIIIGNPRIEQIAESIGTLYKLQFALALPASLPADSSFKGKRIGLIRQSNTPVHQFVHAHHAQLVELNHYQQGLDMLAIGRLDALGGPEGYLRMQFPGNRIWYPEGQWNSDVDFFCRTDRCNATLKQQLTERMPDMAAVVRARLARIRATKNAPGGALSYR